MMTVTKNYSRLSQARVAHAVRVLNDALSDANRIGLLTVVHSCGIHGKQSVKVDLLNPVKLKMGLTNAN